MTPLNRLALIPVTLSFFVMGFVDLVGLVSNYLKYYYYTSDTVANTIPATVFFWFLVGSIPAGKLMSRIGQRRTLMLSLLITSLAMVIPLFSDMHSVLLVAFSFLGIGGTLMHTSLNPLVSLLTGSSFLAAELTFGQFMKSLSAFVAPIIAMVGATGIMMPFGLEWHMLFVVYFLIAIFTLVLLAITPVKERDQDSRQFTMIDCLKLLGTTNILLPFIVVVLQSGIDVGLNVTALRMLMDRFSLDVYDAKYIVGVYFLSRAAGCLLGSVILHLRSVRIVFVANVMVLIASLLGIMLATSIPFIVLCIFVAGFTNSNILAISFARAMLAVPDKRNEVSGLMITALSGGMFIPIITGVVGDYVGQTAAVMVLFAAAVAIFITYLSER